MAGAASSRKIEADVFIDDHNLGGLPDWGEIYQMINDAHEKRHRRRGHAPRWLRKLFGA